MRIKRRFVGLRGRIFLTGSVLLLVLSIVFTGISIYQQRESIRQQLINRGLSIARNLAIASELGVFTGNEEFLKPLVAGLQIEPDLLYAEVYNLKKRLFFIETATHKVGKMTQLTLSETLKAEITARGEPIFFEIFEGNKAVYEFWAPVLSSGIIDGETLFFENQDKGDALKRRTKETVGFVEIEISLQRLEAVTKDALIVNLVMLLPLLPIGFFMTYFIAGKLTEPLGQLAKMTEAVAEGNLTQQIGIKSPDEVGKLAESFNRMITAIKERNDEITLNHQEIEKNYQELEVKTAYLEKQRKALDHSLGEKEVLLREIHHRVKNNMQIISSMLKLHTRYIKDEKDLEIFDDCNNRIRSMALIHEILYRSNSLAGINFQEYISTLVNELLRSYAVDQGHISVKIDVQCRDFSIDTAIPLGLMINELISNALKYAFPDGRDGKITIMMDALPAHPKEESEGEESNEEESEITELIVRDNGIGFPGHIDFRDTETLGLQLVNTLTKQLRGKLTLTGNAGTEFRVRFKVC